MNSDVYYPNSVPPRVLLRIAFLLQIHGGQFNCDRVFEDIRGTLPITKEDFRLAVGFLEKIGIAKLTGESGEVVRGALPPPSRGDQLAAPLGDAIAKHLEKDPIMWGLLQSAHWNPDSVAWVIDPALVPWDQRGLCALLAKTGIVDRPALGSRHWRVTTRYEPMFACAAKALNLSQFHDGDLSQSELENLIALKVDAGGAAEDWVVQRERARLNGHPLVELVRRVSIDNVKAGFDIASFQTERSLVHDRLIEVKSHSGPERFFWTRNEMEAAKRHGLNYVVLLVDRSLIHDSDYEPLEIRDPYHALLRTQQTEWFIEPTEVLVARR